MIVANLGFECVEAGTFSNMGSTGWIAAKSIVGEFESSDVVGIPIAAVDFSGAFTFSFCLTFVELIEGLLLVGA